MCIKLFEEFSDLTIKNNYNQYLKHYKDGTNRNDIVAWHSLESQEKNFNLVERNINNNDSLLDFGCGVGDFIGYLNKKNKNVSNYLGVDINDFYIDFAKKSYPNHNFKLINNIDNIDYKWDIICAIGVFTWFITKDDFIKTINKLYDKANKKILITCLYSITPYKKINNINDQTYINDFWNSEYRYYDKYLFESLFPDFNIYYEYIRNTMLVKILK